MPKYKVYTLKELEAILKKNGFKLEYCKGSHIHYYRRREDGTHEQFVMPFRPNPMIVKRLFKEHNINENI